MSEEFELTNRIKSAHCAIDNNDFDGVVRALSDGSWEGAIAVLCTMQTLLFLTDDDRESLKLRFKLASVQAFMERAVGVEPIPEPESALYGKNESE